MLPFGRRTVAWIVYASFATLCGIAVHLLAELGGLGWRVDAQLIFSQRHTGLGLLAAAAIVVALWGAARLACDSRRGVLDGLPASPCVAIAFAAQLTIFVVTEFGEGAPLDGGDILIGMIVAVIASAVGAFALCRYQTRILRALVEFIDAVAAKTPSPSGFSRRPFVSFIRQCRLARNLGLRAPPHLRIA